LDLRFVATEYSTGKKHSGRIDTLGLDENFCLVIIEYKRNSNANVINQGLFYLDWLKDHKGEFGLLVQRQIGQEDAEQLDWSAPRLLCIAEDFTRFDIHAIQQINRNIELIRYRMFDDDLLLLDLVNVVSEDTKSRSTSRSASITGSPAVDVDDLPPIGHDMPEVDEALREFIMNLSDDVQEVVLKNHTAYKRIGNFACLVRQRNRALLYLKVSPESVELGNGFARDVTGIGHQGTGNLELMLQSMEDLETAKPLIKRSFEEN